MSLRSSRRGLHPITDTAVSQPADARGAAAGRAERSGSAAGGSTAPQGSSYGPNGAVSAPADQSVSLVDLALANHRFPTVEALGVSVALLDQVPVSDVSGNPTAFLEVGPGIVSLRISDVAAIEEREAQREQIAQALAEAEAAKPAELDLGLDDGEEPAEELKGKRQAITEWSAKSRANMVRTLAKLDYTPLFVDGLPAMVTLTYPGDWLTVAPDGQAVKRHFKMWHKRFERTWKRKLRYVAKLEFQRRGAPHVHIFTVPPMGQVTMKDGRKLQFRQWLSESWADVVAHPDPEEYARHKRAGTGVDWNEGLAAKDPKRLAVYFSKHSAAGRGNKEYQHRVPEEWLPKIEYKDPAPSGLSAPALALTRFRQPMEPVEVVEDKPAAKVGRFWWYGGLEKTTAEVAIAEADYLTARRFVRRSSRNVAISSNVPGAKYPARVVPATRVVVREHGGRMRKQNRRAERIGQGINRWTEQVPGGYLTVNDGAVYASQLARALAVKKAPINDPLNMDLLDRLMFQRVHGRRMPQPSPDLSSSVPAGFRLLRPPTA